MTSSPGSPNWSQRVFAIVWLRFCRLIVRVFYRRSECYGLDHLPAQGPVILCANHVNALVDAVIMQAFSPRLLHPLARSGLFAGPLLGHVLRLIQAVPIYRRQDADGDAGSNADSFASCYEFLAAGEVLLIFPEGQSHSDAHLREMKTGVARISLGAQEANGVAPAVVPVGMNFTRKGSFRAGLLVEFGAPVPVNIAQGELSDDAVRRVTAQIQQAIEGLTVNAETSDDIDLVNRMERFFALRRGRYRRGSLRQKFRALRRLTEAQRRLRERDPERVDSLRWQLRQFERLCHRFGVKDYHLSVSYRPLTLMIFLSILFVDLVLLMPLAAWGIANAIMPFLLTRHAARTMARGSDQYDTAKILLGLILFPVFWAGQIAVAGYFYGATVALVYALSLVPGAAAGLLLRREKRRILENIRVFVLFTRKRRLRRFLTSKRENIERELAALVRLARQR